MAHSRALISERGASLVEFALVFPIFMFVLFAIIDGSLGFHSRNSVGLAIADAAREGAIARNAVDADVAILEEIDRRIADSVSVNITRVVVYEAADLQSDPSANCMAGITEPGCNVYFPGDLAAPPTVCDGSRVGGWCPVERREDDLLGVWVRAEFTTLTGLTPLDLEWVDRAIVIVEPEIVE